MNDKQLRRFLFGITSVWNLKDLNKHRVITVNFPAVNVGEPDREIKFSSVDGLILYFVKEIESLNSKIRDLEILKENKSKK